MVHIRASSHHALRHGFTLIELSIVLVIIGLLAGGVLGGRELIKAATVRSQVAQIESFQLGTTTFQLKYNSLPGDLPASLAAENGFVTRAGTFARGDGDGSLEPCDVCASGTSGGSCGETVLFWNDLGRAGLIKGSFVGADGSANGATCTVAANAAAVRTLLPQAKYGMGNSIVVYNRGGLNYYQVMAGPTSIENWGGNTGSSAAAITPIDAKAIDAKIDDGLPLSGLVLARTRSHHYADPAVAATPAAPAAGVCVSNASGNPYNVSADTGGESLACSLSFPFN